MASMYVNQYLATATVRGGVGSAGLRPSVEHINMSDSIVTVNLGGIDYEISPGQKILIPKQLTRYLSHKETTIIEDLAPQLKPTRVYCQTCDTLIGQNDKSGALIEWTHSGPCGLPCIGRGTDARESIEPYHSGEDSCVKCAPRVCPACNGKPEVCDPLKELVGDYTYAIQESMFIVTQWCGRCRGTGQVPGLSCDNE